MEQETLILDRTNLPINEWLNYIDSEGCGLDLVITDPPYPFDNKNGSGRHSYHEGADLMYHRMDWKELQSVFVKIKDLMNDGGRIYVFSNRDGYEKTKQLMLDAGYRYLNTIVWDKERFGGGYHWRNSVEYIHYFCKPKKPAVLVKGARNVFEYKKPTKKCAIPEIGYDPASNDSPKPHEIWRDIILHGGAEGDVVADPFAGSDPLSAALLLNDELAEKVSRAYTNSFDV